ncbi:DUF4190 domain-containing protein [Streptomyces sp. MUSC 14]|uniref:DUF4190 domain-containing protein n=1 Tax=Streptomyces sp. MUSC 14 TaxID=1354889 RepID=UPI000AC17462|nr:DUF4190 domain-containing protein [Streptomyces sp. MUSC 14]
MSDEVPRFTPPEQQPAGERPEPSRVSLNKTAGEQPAGDRAVPVAPQAPAPGAGSFGSVHEQQTVVSLPTDAVSAPWAPPVSAAAPASNPFAAPADPYAPPTATPPSANPCGAPAAPAYPYAPPVGQYPAAEPVPPPPIAPDGPGQLPYYPPTPPAYGDPGAYPAANPYGWPGMQPAPSNGLGTAALVCGILAAVGFLLWPIALVLGILGIIFGAIGRGKAKRGEATNPGMALAGLICGSVGIVLVVGFWAVVIALIN